MFEDTGLARFNAQKRIFYFKGRLKGATLEIGYLKKVKDYSRYHGRPFSYILFDEITEFASWDLVERMGSCLRSKDKKVKCIMRFTGNPGGRLHSIVKKEFYDPAPCGDTVFVTKKGKRRMMIHSTVKDNPFLWNNGEGDYAKWLTSLPDVLRMAWFEGKWDIALGGMFSDVWDRNKHIIDNITPAMIPERWERKRAMDWGSSTPFAVLWYTISMGDALRDGRVYPRGSIIFYNEYYGTPKDGNYNEGLKLSSLQVGKNIKNIESRRGEHPLIKPGPADNQIVNDHDGENSSYAGNMAISGIKFCKCVKSAGSPIIGWEQMRTRFVGNDQPLIYFTKECPHSIRTIPDIARHPTNFDDIDSGQEDHCTDVVKYVCLDNKIDLRTPEAIAAMRRRRHGQSPLQSPR